MALIFPTLPGLAWSVTKTPTFQTRIQRAASGRELRALDYPYPLWQFALVYDFLRDDPAAGYDELRTLLGFFMLCQGAFRHISVSRTRATARSPGSRSESGNASTTVFQLQRAMGATLPGGGFLEPIISPEHRQRAIYFDGITQNPCEPTMSIPTSGLVTFATAPGSGLIISRRFHLLFPLPVHRRQIRFREFHVSAVAVEKADFHLGAVMKAASPALIALLDEQRSVHHGRPLYDYSGRRVGAALFGSADRAHRQLAIPSPSARNSSARRPKSSSAPRSTSSKSGLSRADRSHRCGPFSRGGLAGAARRRAPAAGTQLHADIWRYEPRNGHPLRRPHFRHRLYPHQCRHPMPLASRAAEYPDAAPAVAVLMHPSLWRCDVPVRPVEHADDFFSRARLQSRCKSRLQSRRARLTYICKEPSSASPAQMPVRAAQSQAWAAAGSM